MKHIIYFLIMGMLVLVSCSNDDVLENHEIEPINSTQAATKPIEVGTIGTIDCSRCGVIPQVLKAYFTLKVGEYRVIGGMNGDKTTWDIYPYAGSLFIPSGANATIMYPRAGEYMITGSGYERTGSNLDGDPCYCKTLEYYFYITVVGISEPTPFD